MLQEKENLLTQNVSNSLENEQIKTEDIQFLGDNEAEENSEIKQLNYQNFSLEELVDEFSRLLSEEKIQKVKANAIKNEFEQKYATLLNNKKSEFLAEGGNVLDFSYDFPLRKTFLNLYEQYKKKRVAYYQAVNEQLQLNLIRKREIITEIKNVIEQGIISLDNLGETFKKFKELKEAWYNVGAVPNENYNDLWNNFNYHCERFYDYIELNKELRDREFKNNLNEKLKIIEEAETLFQEVDVNKAFRRLQVLHRIWKEEIGPVERQYREEIWQKFSEITKKIHQKREIYLSNQEQEFQKNADSKQKVIFFIKKITESGLTTHAQWQGAVEDIEKLRNYFLQIGKVSQQLNDSLWKDFNKAIREFNQAKNDFYKGIKREQQENLAKKNELIAKAKEYQFSENWEDALVVMQNIQEEWKKIGFVSRKDSDRIWNEFRTICDGFFERFNNRKEEETREKEEAFLKKSAYLDEIKEFTLSGNIEKDLQLLQEITNKWNSFGKVAKKKKGVNTKFEKVIFALYRKLGYGRLEIDMIRYQDRLNELKNDLSPEAISNEKTFIQKRIEELTSEIIQLENNLQYFNSAADTKNPLLKEALKNVTDKKELLEIWKVKLKEVLKLC